MKVLQLQCLFELVEESKEEEEEEGTYLYCTCSTLLAAAVPSLLHSQHLSYLADAMTRRGTRTGASSYCICSTCLTAAVPSLPCSQYLSDIMDEEEEEEGTHHGPSHGPGARGGGKKRQALARRGENRKGGEGRGRKGMRWAVGCPDMVRGGREVGEGRTGICCRGHLECWGNHWAGLQPAFACQSVERSVPLMRWPHAPAGQGAVPWP